MMCEECGYWIESCDPHTTTSYGAPRCALHPEYLDGVTNARWHYRSNERKIAQLEHELKPFIAKRPALQAAIDAAQAAVVVPA